MHSLDTTADCHWLPSLKKENLQSDALSMKAYVHGMKLGGTVLGKTIMMVVKAIKSSCQTIRSNASVTGCLRCMKVQMCLH